MNKTLLLFICFLIIGGLAFYLIDKKETKTTVSTKDRNFAVEDIEAVHKIFLADRNGKTITLEKKNTYWLANAKWKANPNAIANLLNTIQKVKIKYVPPRAAIDNIIRDIATNNIKVEIYDRAGIKLKSYYVGGVTNDELGTHMIMDGANEPFVTYIPGFEGALRVRFMLDELNWRDKTIFSESMDNIESLSIEYPKQKNLSFKIERKNDQFSVTPFNNVRPTTGKETNRGLVEKYLIGYERLVAESFENENKHRDSITQLLPFSIIHLKTKNKQEKTVKLYPIIKKNNMGQIILNEAGSPLIEKYFADVNGQDFMLIQQLVFGKVLWTYDGFF